MLKCIGYRWWGNSIGWYCFALAIPALVAWLLPITYPQWETTLHGQFNPLLVRNDDYLLMRTYEEDDQPYLKECAECQEGYLARKAKLPKQKEDHIAFHIRSGQPVAIKKSNAEMSGNAVFADPVNWSNRLAYLYPDANGRFSVSLLYGMEVRLPSNIEGNSLYGVKEWMSDISCGLSHKESVILRSAGPKAISPNCRWLALCQQTNMINMQLALLIDKHVPLLSDYASFLRHDSQSLLIDLAQPDQVIPFHTSRNRIKFFMTKSNDGFLLVEEGADRNQQTSTTTVSYYLLPLPLAWLSPERWFTIFGLFVLPLLPGWLQFLFSKQSTPSVEGCGTDGLMVNYISE